MCVSAKAWFLVVAAAIMPGPLLAGDSRGEEYEPVIELPPFVITKDAGPDWKYAQADGMEVLTQAGARQSNEVFAALWRGRRMMVPPAFVTRYSVPMTVVLFNQLAEKDTALTTLGSVRKADEPRKHWVNLIKRSSPDRESFAMNLWKSDFKYSVTFRFYTNTLLRGRTPAAPGWLQQGLFGPDGLYREGFYWRWGDKTKEVPEARWFSPTEARLAHELRRKAEAAGTEIHALDLGEIESWIPDLALLFGVQTAPPGLTRTSSREEAAVKASPEARPAPMTVTLAPIRIGSDFPERLASAAALFVRWGIYGDKGAHAEKFWRFAEQACAEPVTEARFKECLGMSFAEVRSELARYLPAAIAGMEQFPVGPVQRPPVLDFREATDWEIGRMRGEWERLEAETLHVDHPDLARRYREQAATRFKRNYRDGDRDPRLLASMGLLALDGNEREQARELLTSAAAARVAGPRVYFELARIHWQEAEAAGGGGPSEATVAEVTELLLTGESQSPALPAIYGFLAEMVLQRKSASPAVIAALQRGLVRFPRTPQGLSGRLAHALALVELPADVSGPPSR